MIRTEQEIKEARDVFQNMLESAQSVEVRLCIAAQLDSLRWALGEKGTKAEAVLSYGVPMLRAEKFGDEATANRIAAEVDVENRRMEKAAWLKTPHISSPRFEIGDRVIYNANLDKSPDPENAGIVGTVRAYTKEGHNFRGGNCPAGLCLVDWDGLAGVPLEAIHPINDDWLEPATTTVSDTDPTKDTNP